MLQIVKKGEDYLILDENKKVCGVVNSADIIDGDKVAKKESRYAAEIAALDNESLIKALIETVTISVLDKEDRYTDFDILSELVFNEVMRRMSK